jgi:HD-like signal output (HDOD) protein
MTQILFVDDRQEVLDGLRTMLHRRRNDWRMQFVNSGAAAIAELEKQPYDIICSDMRMPSMDGAQLLTIVAERWPEAVRIILSGHAAPEQTIRLVPIAHQYLSKPCEAKQIEATFERCLKVREMLKRPELRSLVGRVKQLPASPKTYGNLCAAMGRTDASATEIAKIVASDPAIAARVLQVVNSAFFRLPRQIAKIEQAVSYLGFTAIRNLTLSAEVFSASKKTPTLKGFTFEAVQLEAVKTAAVMRALTKETALADDAFVVGLLHDVGLIILLEACPAKLQAASDESLKAGVPLAEAERKHIGASHAEVGAYLLAIWGLPYTIVEAVAYQHEPEHRTQAEFDLLSALAIALKMLSDEKQLHHPIASVVDADYLKRVGAPFSWEEARQRTQTVIQAGEQA